MISRESGADRGTGGRLAAVEYRSLDETLEKAAVVADALTMKPCFTLKKTATDKNRRERDNRVMGRRSSPAASFATAWTCWAFALAVLVVAGCAPQDKPGYYQGKHLRYWEALAGSPDPVQRRTAAESLGKMGPLGIPALLKLMEDTDRRVRTTAIIGFVGLRGEAAPKLTQMLRSPDTNTKMAAIKACIFLGNDAKAVVPALQELQDSDPSAAIREMARRALLPIAGKGKPVFREEGK